MLFVLRNGRSGTLESIPSTPGGYDRALRIADSTAVIADARDAFVQASTGTGLGVALGRGALAISRFEIEDRIRTPGRLELRGSGAIAKLGASDAPLFLLAAIARDTCIVLAVDSLVWGPPMDGAALILGLASNVSSMFIGWCARSRFASLDAGIDFDPGSCKLGACRCISKAVLLVLTLDNFFFARFDVSARSSSSSATHSPAWPSFKMQPFNLLSPHLTQPTIAIPPMAAF